MKLSAIAFLVAVIMCRTSLADDNDTAAKASISVSIAIPVHHGHRSLNDGDHFHVVVRNVSEKPLRVWTDRFSWGYDNLSFEQTHDDGKTTRITKKERGWRKNYPDWLELQPGECYVLNVNLFSTDIWNEVPGADPKAKPKLVKLQAIYEVQPDEESKKLGVWAGKVVSATDTFAIW